MSSLPPADLAEMWYNIPVETRCFVLQNTGQSTQVHTPLSVVNNPAYARRVSTTGSRVGGVVGLMTWRLQ